jgi:hypothetical protein
MYANIYMKRRPPIKFKMLTLVMKNFVPPNIFRKHPTYRKMSSNGKTVVQYLLLNI